MAIAIGSDKSGFLLKEAIKNYLKEIKVEEINEFESELHNYFRIHQADILQEIIDKQELTEGLKDKLSNAVDAYVDQYKRLNGK